jgi:hypothetical protein
MEILLYIIISSWNRPELFELLRHPRRGMHGQVYDYASREVTTPTCVDVISISRCRVWLTPWSFHDPRYCWGMGLMEMRGKDASRWLEKPHREERSINCQPHRQRKRGASTTIDSTANQHKLARSSSPPMPANHRSSCTITLWTHYRHEALRATTMH